MYPPQAFTREMLSQAFVWLQAQPESVRGLASNPESLIALYLKAQRSQLQNQKKMESQNSNPQSDAPVSAQNFMTDLKSLAEGLKQFEDPRASAHYQAPQHHLPPPPGPHQFAAAPMPSQQNPNTNLLNANCQHMIREVKEKFNLSSEAEAINMLVAIAYKNLKSLIE